MKTKVSTRIDGTDFEFNTKFSHGEAIRFYDPFHSQPLHTLWWAAQAVSADESALH